MKFYRLSQAPCINVFLKPDMFPKLQMPPPNAYMKFQNPSTHGSKDMRAHKRVMNKMYEWMKRQMDEQMDR